MRQTTTTTKAFMEPTSGAAAGVLGAKFGVATGIGAVFAAVIAMSLATPKTAKEWAAGLTATVAGSMFGGAAVIQHYDLAGWMDQGFFGIAGLIGICFACGTPLWLGIRALFAFMNSGGGNGIIRSAVKKWLGE